jgi:integrase
VAFRDPITGIIGTKRSTGTGELQKAESIAQTWLRDGLPGKPCLSLQSFADYLDAFWDFDHSSYIQESLAAGKKIHRRHVQDMKNLVRRYIRPYFGSKNLKSIDEATLRRFLLYLKIDRGYASATVNQVRNATVVALRYAKRDHLIKSFDFDLVLRCGTSPQKRGILEPNEVNKLFKARWRDPRSRLVNLIAAETGMRMGEIRALRVCDIGLDRFFIRNSWSLADGGLKETKTGEKREVPLLPSLKTEILSYLNTIVLEDGSGSFVFPGLRNDRPFDEGQIRRDFFAALALIGIDDSRRRERNIVFHSWRHYVAKHLSHIAPKALGMKILGHKTSAVFDKYADHTSLEDLSLMRRALSSIKDIENPEKLIQTIKLKPRSSKKEQSA